MAKFTNDQKEILNNANPANQLVQLGGAILEGQERIEDLESGTLHYITAVIDSDHTTAKVVATAPFDLRIVDVIVEATAGVTSGTCKIQDGAGADITDAIIMAVDKVIVRAGTIDRAKASIDAGDSIKAITHGATNKGIVTLVVKRV